MPKVDDTVVMEEVRIIFRNLAGKEGEYNRAGDRNFGVIIPDEDTAAAMERDGWNIKRLKPREEDEEGEETPWLPVTVNFDKGRPPKIMIVTSRGRSALDENTVEMLDWADIQNVDMIVRPYHWDVNGKQGVKAYLQSMFVTIDEDPLERKYAEMDEQ